MSYEKANRCYKKYDFYYILLFSFLFLVPIIDLLVVNNLVSSINYVNWVNYYNNGNTDYNSVVNANETIYDLLIGNESFEDYSFEKEQKVIINQAEVANFNVPYNLDPQLGYTNNLNFTMFGQRQYLFNFGNESNEDMILYDSFPLDNIIKNYRHGHTVSKLMSTLTPIMPINTYDDGSNITYSIFNNFKDRFQIFPSCWDDFWDNFELYFYMVDGDHNGVGYSYGRNESESIDDLETKQLIMNGDVYTIQMYNINFSSELKYSTSGNFYFSYYNASKVGEQYNIITDVFNSFLIDLGINLSSYVNVSDFEGKLTSISSITEHRGFYDHADFNCNEFGYYIRLANGFNISKYIEMYRYDVNYFDLGYEFANGVMIYFNDLFLGEIKDLNVAIQNILTLDLLLIVVPLGIIVVLNVYPSKSRKEFKLENDQFCKLK